MQVKWTSKLVSMFNWAAELMTENEEQKMHMPKKSRRKYYCIWMYTSTTA